MAYEDAIDWLTENLPIEMYDSYSDWYNACKEEITTPALWGSSRFNRMHEDYWRNNRGTIEREQDVLPQEMRAPQEQYEREEITRRPPESFREPEQPLEQEPYYPSEQERIIPETGRAPELYARQEQIDMTAPKEPRYTFIGRTRNFIRRALGL